MMQSIMTHKDLETEKEKEIERLQSRIYYLRNTEKIKASSQKYRQEHPEYNKNAVGFLGRKILLDHNPRTGKCSECGFIGKTHMHHKQYHEDDPLKDTVELCIQCHTKTFKPSRYWLGKTHTQETRRKISQGRKGIPAWNKNSEWIGLSEKERNRLKAKRHYQKIKDDIVFKQKNRENTRRYYEANKNNPAFREKERLRLKLQDMRRRRKIV